MNRNNEDSPSIVDVSLSFLLVRMFQDELEDYYVFIILLCLLRGITLLQQTATKRFFYN